MEVSEINDYRYFCPKCHKLMKFLEEVTEDRAAFWCKTCNKVEWVCLL